MIRARAHIWHDNCEKYADPRMPRMDRWMEEYDSMRLCNGTYSDAWLEYCGITNGAVTHHAGDLLS
jgi:hypothetical protein